MASFIYYGQVEFQGILKYHLTATKALYQQWSNAISFKDILLEFGGEIVEKIEGSNYNFSLDNLQKDSFINIFKKDS